MTEITNDIELPYEGPVLLTLTYSAEKGGEDREARHADLELLIEATATEGAYTVVLGHALGGDLLKDPGLSYAHLAIPSGGTLQGRVASVDRRGFQLVLVEDETDKPM
ncbi:hypothetical protein PS627_04313 [Pseudomonas fluorescens]|uniref:hypothetical protein n=1 Tax=Pseudomonas fluorescens TaxID=294 RepID=UPI0012558C76|nr:hypothetical protein [Pseudomonas fluorescens]CAG8871132.1 hypothetical protein PS627_04313 [Pseudomonas fluorescens]VVP67830.1 hypothetical protein PS910_00264 [Pseudomonas fluorescens]